MRAGLQAQGRRPERRHDFLQADRLSEEEWGRALTSIAPHKLEAMAQWQWTSVLLKVMWLGIAVGRQVRQHADLHGAGVHHQAAQDAGQLRGVCGIFFVIGEIMFLIPVVPAAKTQVQWGVRSYRGFYVCESR